MTLIETAVALEEFPTDGIVAQRLAETGTSAAEPGLDRAEGGTGGGRDLPVVATLDVGQENDQTLVLGEGGEGAVLGGSDEAVVCSCRGSSVVVGGRVRWGGLDRRRHGRDRLGPAA